MRLWPAPASRTACLHSAPALRCSCLVGCTPAQSMPAIPCRSTERASERLCRRCSPPHPAASTCSFPAALRSAVLVLSYHPLS